MNPMTILTETNLLDQLENMTRFAIHKAGDSYQIVWYVERTEWRTYAVSARRTETRLHKRQEHTAVSITKEIAKAITSKMEEIGRFFAQRKAANGTVERHYCVGYTSNHRMG